MYKSDPFDPAGSREAFTKHLGMFAFPEGSHLLARTAPLGNWLEQREGLGTWPYARTLEQAPGTVTRLESQGGARVEGINFGSQDYLGLSAHPALRNAAMNALLEFGPHTASSPMLQGNTLLSRQ
ncbi:MAG TPA: pyridoxal phosphate-dependent aminotransferase family protein, partial [Thermoanaerobaculia bacterium]|nr:pyridoxal phosphate-dependent aminotransferase family protein [Thermoanaerobaculia bacterium]